MCEHHRHWQGGLSSRATSLLVDVFLTTRKMGQELDIFDSAPHLAGRAGLGAPGLGRPHSGGVVGGGVGLEGVKVEAQELLAPAKGRE